MQDKNNGWTVQKYFITSTTPSKQNAYIIKQD